MIIQIITRTFKSEKEKNNFELFFVSKWKKLIRNIPGCALKLFTDNKKPFNFNAVWEFDNKNKQEEVMNLIKNHNREFQGPIPSKSLNTYGDISIILKY